MKYIVVEIQTNQDGAVGTLVNAYDDRNSAESQYHTVLAAAAISQLPCHSAILVTQEGFLLADGCYKHGQTPVAESEETE